MLQCCANVAECFTLWAFPVIRARIHAATFTANMTAQDPNQTASTHDPILFAQNMAQAAQEWLAITQELARHRMEVPDIYEDQESLYVGKLFMEALATLIADPNRILEMQHHFFMEWVDLWRQSAERFIGIPVSRRKGAEEKDRRFRDDAWQQSAIYDFIKQSYLLNAKWVQQLMHEAGEMDPKLAKSVDFYTRQFVDAAAPSNFLLTNPEAMRMTLESNGENLVQGLRNMRKDIERGGGKLKIRMTDDRAFALGRNLAMTPGKVVYQNELMQLIQYAPSTEKVHEVPLLFIPAWINKFYIADLQSENSLIRWLVEQGYTVFVISWANPDKKLSRKTFEDYLQQGPLAALDAIRDATGEEQVNVLGYCLGGTLLSITLAWLTAKGQEHRVRSATFLTTMIDFTEPGELAVFIEEEQLKILEKKMVEKGFLAGDEMANVFNMLRANDLIWSFVVNNYLLGKEPFPFDILYWNSDATRMPAAMHSFYLRNMYQKNLLRKPGGITLGGVPIHLRKVKTPAYFLSTREDHIAPWKSTYAGTQIFSGPVEFTLAASGHVAGVVNPPAKKKYCYWSHETKHQPKTPEDWLMIAHETPGSWWPHWEKWLRGHAGKMIKARIPGTGKLKAIEDAPGSYVKMR